MKSFYAEAGFGFIRRDVGDDVYVNASGILEGIESGDSVEFQIRMTGGGEAASNVRKVPEEEE
ncbi:MAG: cold shock domain-containing protein [Candidatus Thermoplasmatota archaeon]|nr:cold shock domain-containing protein [Candidatus Thermoplasmatota archaeon]